jgi:hypothetical protein
MAVTVCKPVHKLISKHGAMLWLPASCFGTAVNLTVPDVYQQDSAQQFPIGWHYSP